MVEGPGVRADGPHVAYRPGVADGPGVAGTQCATPAAMVGIESAIAARAGACDRGAATLADDLALLRAAGLATAPLPRPHGGSDWAHGGTATTELFDVLRMLGRANLSVARLYEGHVNAIKLAVLYGAPGQLERLARMVRAGGWLGVWGADGDPPVRLEGSSGALRLRGAKRFASGLGLIDEAVVVVSGTQGAQLVLAPCGEAQRADASSWRVGGMRATASGVYDFDGVSAEPLGHPGDYMREPWFEGGVWRYCAAHLGGAEALRDAMTALLVRLDRAHDPHQRVRLAEAAMACETARLWIAQAAHRVEGSVGAPCRDASGAAAYALLAREATERACVTLMQTVDRALGTMAHGDGTVVERVRRDLGLFLRQANPDAKLALAAAALVGRGGRADTL